MFPLLYIPPSKFSMCFISKPPNMAYSNLSNSNGEIISFNRSQWNVLVSLRDADFSQTWKWLLIGIIRYDSYYMDQMIFTDHIDISTAFLRSSPGQAKYFTPLVFLWLILKQLVKRFILKTVCMWWFMFRKLSPISRLSHRFLSTEYFHYRCTFKRLQILFLQYAGMKCSV